jgi:hypothetical protein
VHCISGRAQTSSQRFSESLNQVVWVYQIRTCCSEVPSYSTKDKSARLLIPERVLLPLPSPAPVCPSPSCTKSPMRRCAAAWVHGSMTRRTLLFLSSAEPVSWEWPWERTREVPRLCAQLSSKFFASPQKLAAGKVARVVADLHINCKRSWRAGSVPTKTPSSTPHHHHLGPCFGVLRRGSTTGRLRSGLVVKPGMQESFSVRGIGVGLGAVQVPHWTIALSPLKPSDLSCGSP